MELDALYNLKQRLIEVAIAGTDSMPKNLALRGAVILFSQLTEERRAFAPLAAEARSLLSAPAESRSARLMDVLGMLISAERACAPSDLAGALEPLPPGVGSYVPTAYSQLQPLISALGSSGSARLTILEDAWAERPEYVSDFRVLPCLADALGDPNEEFEEFSSFLLTKLGKRVVPFLKEGFDPDGKRASARRVYWVARLSGAEENEWLRSVLPESRREAREAVIAALGVSQDNAPLLLELCQNESGKCADAALRALAHMEDEDSRAFWAEELERRPDCPPCLEGVDSPLAADMAARALRDVLSEALAREKPECNQAQLLTIAHVIFAAYGKCSDALREELLRCAEQIDALEKLRPDRTVRHWDLSAAEMLEKCLLETVLWNPCEAVTALADELAARCPGHFLGASVLAEVIAHPESAFDRFGKLIVKNGLLHRENAAERANRIQIMRALAAVYYDSEDGWHIPFSRKDAITGAPVGQVYHLASFDPRWAEALWNPKVNQDGTVFDLENPWSMTKQMLRREDLTPQEEGAQPPAE